MCPLHGIIYMCTEIVRAHFLIEARFMHNGHRLAVYMGENKGYLLLLTFLIQSLKIPHGGGVNGIYASHTENKAFCIVLHGNL